MKANATLITEEEECTLENLGAFCGAIGSDEIDSCWQRALLSSSLGKICQRRWSTYFDALKMFSVDEVRLSYLRTEM